MNFPSFVDARLKNHILKRVNAVCKNAGLNHQDREDAIEYVLVSLCDDLPKWDPRRGSRFQYAKTIIHNSILDFLRRHRAEKRNVAVFILDNPHLGIYGEDDVEMTTFAEIVPDADRWDGVWDRMDLEAMIEWLPRPYGTIARLIFEGFTYEEICRVLGITDSIFRKRFLPRFRRLCRRFLKN